MGNGGVSASESMRSEFALTSRAPVASFSFTAPLLFSTFPVTAITNSLLSDAAFSKPASSMSPFSNII